MPEINWTGWIAQVMPSLGSHLRELVARQLMTMGSKIAFDAAASQYARAMTKSVDYFAAGAVKIGSPVDAQSLTLAYVQRLRAVATTMGAHIEGYAPYAVAVEQAKEDKDPVKLKAARANRKSYLENLPPADRAALAAVGIK